MGFTLNYIKIFGSEVSSKNCIDFTPEELE